MIVMIDIGGTNIKYGVINPQTEDYQLLGELPTATGTENFQMEKRLDIIIQSLIKNYEIKGIAISTAGVVDADTGEIIYANKNIPNYKGTPLKQLLEKKYQVPVAVENDVNSALLGELTFGSYGTVHSALMLTIGTGVGGALYLNGHIHHGFSHSGGEVGYSIVNGQNIEDIASTRALVERVEKKSDEPTVNGHWIFDQAIHHKNPLAIEEIDYLIEGITQLINNYVALLNPQYVILGGGIMEQVDYLKPKIIKRFEEMNKNKLVVKNTTIEFARLGNQAGMLGAFVHFKEKELKN